MLHRNSVRRRSAEDGISEVVGFVVILAVVIAGLSLYLTYAVPVQGREEEIKVMDGVRSWFVDYKTGVDQLWLNSPTTTDPDTSLLFKSTVNQVTLRRVIDTGTVREKGFVGRFMPVLAPIPSSAEVSVGNIGNFTISGWRNGIEVFNWKNATPALAYTSHNYYWLQQEYYYQLGGVFLRQWGGGGGPDTENVTVIAAPPFSIYDHSPEEGGTSYQTKVSLVVVNLTVPAGGFGSTSPIRVETRLNEDPARPDAGVGNPGYAEVSLQFDGMSNETALAWENMFAGVAARNRVASNYTPHHSGHIAWINITGGREDDLTTNDVLLEVLVANYSTRMGNVPTMIE